MFTSGQTGSLCVCDDSFMNYRPLHDRLVVRRLDDGEQIVGGLVIPDSAKEKPEQDVLPVTGRS